MVVDEKYGELLPIYQKYLEGRHAHLQNGENLEQTFLQDVYDLAKQTIKYDRSKVLAIDEELKKEKPDQLAVKVSLDTFIRHGVGTCRHQALLEGYLAEKAINEGLASGHVSVDRNSQPGIGLSLIHI